jgi:putative ABC transport system permease protein
MIKNYFKTGIRNIRRNYAYSILNITGMAIGLASAILILLWVEDEWSYDRHFKNADNLYRIIESQNPAGGVANLLVPTPGALAATLKKEYPEIIRATRYTPSPLTLKKGDEFIEEMVTSVDKDFLKMFNVEFVQGDINSALNEPHNIVFTEEMAKKYFGAENALGQKLESRGYFVTVTGIIKSLPHNSHIKFDFLVPIDWMKDFGGPTNEWQPRDYNYIELKKGTDGKLVEDKIKDILQRHIDGSKSEILLQNIKKIHLFSSRKYSYDVSGHGDITYVRILSLVALFILIIACINFMNLSTAQSSGRAKEICIRKIVGADKRKIVVQFLGESFLVVFVAIVISMIFVEVLLPGFNNLTGKQLNINYQSGELYIGLISIVLFCGLLAGSYPAFYLSSLKPLEMVKGIINRNPGNPQLRRVLVFFQYSLSILLIICTLVVGRQLDFMQNADLGFNKENIGYFMFPARSDDPQLESFKKELVNDPDILSVTTTHGNPCDLQGTSSGFTWEGKKEGENILFYTQGVDADYAKTFKLEIKEGRFFSSEFSTDASAIVINEQASKILGFKKPVGEVVSDRGRKLTIIGVVKDFHFKSLHYKIEPLIMGFGIDNNIYIRMKPDKTASAVDFIEKKYKSFGFAKPIDFRFLDDFYESQYRTEQRICRISRNFSCLALIISCLGLIGLSSFMAGRRIKEIGIRKINGANAFEIFSLLSGEYIILVMISIIIACPVAWYFMNKWLQNYAYRINLSWWIFVVTGLLVMLISLLTVSVQSYRAASSNPVRALRYE